MLSKKVATLTGFAILVFILFPALASLAETINYEYDQMSRLIRTQYGDGTVVEYSYDNMGNRIQKRTTVDGAPTNNPPYPASDPTIVNGATEVTTTPILSWTGGDPDAGDEVVYYIYFGTSGNLSLAASGVQTSFEPGQLDPLTAYCWQIVTRDSHNADTPGPVWCFTTRDDGSGVLAPEINLKQGAVNIFDGGTYDFGERMVGSDTGMVFTIENNGNADLTLYTPLYYCNSEVRAP